MKRYWRYNILRKKEKLFHRPQAQGEQSGMKSNKFNLMNNQHESIRMISMQEYPQLNQRGRLDYEDIKTFLGHFEASNYLAPVLFCH